MALVGVLVWVPMIYKKEKIESILALDGDARYKFFIKTVADWEEVWGLYSEGWAMAGSGQGEKILPFWPAREFAELCAKAEWSEYIPKSIDLEFFLSTVLVELEEADVLPGIFYTPDNKGTTPSLKKVISDLEQELENY